MKIKSIYLFIYTFEFMYKYKTNIYIYIFRIYHLRLEGRHVALMAQSAVDATWRRTNNAA